LATKNTIRDEIIRCGRDPVYFIKKYVRIQHPVRGLIPFALFDYQEDLIRDYLKNRFNVILKARQLGISEVTAAYALWLILFHRDKNVVVMASKDETAKNIVRKVRTAFKKLPKWLVLADQISDNVKSIELTNGSRIHSIATSGDAGRSEAVSLMIVDEAAFIPGFDDLWTGIYPVVQAGGRAIILSTPNGVGNKYHQLYTDAETGENDFNPTRLMWWRHPEHVADLEDDPLRPGFKTSSWFRKEVKSANMGPREVAQELECNFNASGDTVITGERLEEIEKGVLPPISMELEDRALHVWWPYDSGNTYLITADVARGDGKDYSAAHIFELRNMSQVAEYYAKVPPDQFAKSLCKMGETYGNAMLVIENNQVGLACLEHVRLACYPNVYYSRRGDQKPGEAVNTLFGIHDPDLIPGFTTSQRTRPLICNKLEEYIRTRSMVIRSRRFLQELRTFIWNNGRPEAMKGYNDDLVMSGAIAAWVRDTVMGPSFATQEVNKKLMNAMSKTTTLNSDIPGANKDPKIARQQALGIFGGGQTDPRKMKITLPNGIVEDYSWILKG
jgi:hypothetical protein